MPVNTECSHCLRGIHADYIEGYDPSECWCCGFKFLDSKAEDVVKYWRLGERTMVEDLWGKLTNSEYGNKDFVFDVRAWKGNFGDTNDPMPCVVETVHGYRLHNWNDVDFEDDELVEPGGPGICFLVEFNTPNGRPYTVQVVVPKDELIKALATLVE